MSHYDWLEQNVEAFFASLNIDPSRANKGFIVAHGDKCYSYRYEWEQAGIPFEHGVAIYFLTYLRPYSEESRETKNGWVPVDQWVIDNYERFKPHLNPIE